MRPPALIISDTSTGKRIEAFGAWTVAGFAADPALQKDMADQLTRLARTVGSWDLTQVDAIDHLGAFLFMRAWGRHVPTSAAIDAESRRLFDRIAALATPAKPFEPPDLFAFFVFIGAWCIGFAGHLREFIRLTGQTVIDFFTLAKRPSVGPWREVSATIYRAGFQALSITALVGFLIGVVLSYLSARQLKVFGADVFIIDLLGIGLIRELGPMLAAIIVAGRSGSAMTAAIGVMRLTEELDALSVMGIPHGYRLVLPKVIGLGIALPLITIWTCAIAIFGGMIAAYVQLGLSINYFFDALPNAVKIANFWLAVSKGAVFGVLIALVACHFGLKIRPNTRSLAAGTTASVVTAITVVILVDALFAIVFENVGF